MTANLVAVALQVTRVLERLDVPYIISGSVASMSHGRIRTTMDVDIVAGLRLAEVDRFVEALKDSFYVDAGAAQDAVRQQRGFNLIHFDTAYKVDIFVATDEPFDRQRLARGSREAISTASDQTAFVATAEDMILAKLVWYRLGHEVSDVQWEDVLSLLKFGGTELDRDYLHQWAETLGVGDLLAAAREQTGE